MKIDKKFIPRICRLNAVLYAFQYYYMRELLHECLNSNINYSEAESLAELGSVMAKREVKPSEFIKSSDELTDELINNNDKYEEWRQVCEIYGISSKRLEAFCKNLKREMLYMNDSMLHIWYSKYTLDLLEHLENGYDGNFNFIKYSLSGYKIIANKKKTIVDLLKIERMLLNNTKDE